MSLQAITDPQGVAAAYAEFVRHFETGGDVLGRNIGYLGGSESATLRWYPDLKFWVMLEPERLGNRYWCAFGVDNPQKFTMLNITCELNPPHQGIDRRCAAVFVCSNNGTIYLAHSGRVGGGRAGISKLPFLKFYGDDTVDIVHWPDGQRLHYIVIGALDDDELRSLVAGFVHKVAQFKGKAVGGG